MQIGHWQFAPRLWPSVITFLVLPVLVSLGFWQLDRAEQKRELHGQFLSHQSADPIDLNLNRAIRETKSEIMWRHIRLAGQFAEQTHILLDNQVVRREPGYFVLTPFRLADEDVWLLVNRGWLPAGLDRSVAPVIDTPADEVELIAIATDVPATGLLLGDKTIEQMNNGIVRAQRINIAEISELSGQEFLPFIARLEPESSHGFVREWVLPGSGEEKHLGYAFQWFALSLALLIIYLAVNTRRTKHKHD